ncbi:hypothetical protein EDD85DRAFT_964705 [Armillaria nabsnona]|nr:hypothetical protein EDD85DRAFT_964705 [Armillaria nabsnona]
MPLSLLGTYIYITNLAYIYYLSDIAQFRKSIIYHDFIPRLTRTITCSIDLQKAAMEAAVKRVYHILLRLPNVVGFKTLFPLVPHISFVFRWTGVVRNSDIPICVRYHWHLSRIPGGIYGETRLDVYIIVKDSRRIRYSTLSPSMETLRQLGVLRNFESLFQTRGWKNYSGTTDGFRTLHRIVKVYQQQGDIKDINKRLWMASKGPSRRLGCLTGLFNYVEYQQVQQSFPPDRLPLWRSYNT